MKKLMMKLFFFPVLLAGFMLMLCGQASAQAFKTLHSFTGGIGGTDPHGLVTFGNTLYGTTGVGGTGGSGTVFKMNTDGSGFAILYNFTKTTTLSPGVNVNSDGSAPVGVSISGNRLYGTTSDGGTGGSGTVFAVNTDGTDFATLHSFSKFTHLNVDGSSPRGGLVLSGDTLYGTARSSGPNGSGTVFAIKTNGTGFTVLHSFEKTTYVDFVGAVNAEGSDPVGSLVLSGHRLYGTAILGGSALHGTVFALNTDGSDFSVLHTFSEGVYDGRYYNIEGANPESLVAFGSKLYGTADSGGSAGRGTVFALNPDGTDFTVLYELGESDLGGMDVSVVSGGTLYLNGTYLNFFNGGYGGFFAINTDGTGFTNLHSFTGGGDGAGPRCGGVLIGNTLYGTTGGDGISRNGTVFSLSLGAVNSPQLTLTPSGSNGVLSWPTDATGFTLQSTTNLVSPVWDAVSTAPVVVNGMNTITKPISGAQQYFRLIK